MSVKLVLSAGVKPSEMFKSLLYVGEGRKDVVMVMMRGDHELNEVKLARVLGTASVHMATEADVKATTGAEGPVRLFVSAVQGNVICPLEAYGLRT